jgi:hypothetical protein
MLGEMMCGASAFLNTFKELVAVSDELTRKLLKTVSM